MIPILLAGLLAGTAVSEIALAQGAPARAPSAMSAEQANQKGRDALDRNDYADALRWFRLAAAQGYAPAQSSIGRLYYDGQGVPQDYAQAQSWQRKAAVQGYAPAQFALGSLYHKGEGVVQDYVTAMAWFRKSADGGYTVAQIMVGMMYALGEGVKPDPEAAKLWFQKAGGGSGATAQSAPPTDRKIDITLWCDQPTLNGGTVKSLVSIDTKSKYVKFETPLQETIELRDGFFGKAITSGYMAAESPKVQQFVVIADNSVRFGFRDSKAVVHENTIDLSTGILRISGQITQCTAASSGR